MESVDEKSCSIYIIVLALYWDSRSVAYTSCLKWWFLVEQETLYEYVEWVSWWFTSLHYIEAIAHPMWTIHCVSDGWPYDAAFRQSSNSWSVALLSAAYFAGPWIVGHVGKKLLSWVLGVPKVLGGCGGYVKVLSTLVRMWCMMPHTSMPILDHFQMYHNW